MSQINQTESAEYPERSTGGLGFRLNVWFAAVVTGVSLVVFLVGYYLLASTIRQKDRELILAQLDTYRAWYEQDGLAGLSTHFSNQGDSGKDTFFVRILGPDQSGLFLNRPRASDAFDLNLLLRTNTVEGVNWIKIPSADHSTSWLVANARLSGGRWLQVGKTTEAQAALLEHFRLVFGVTLALALVFGVVAGMLMTGRALRPIRQLIGAFRNVINTGRMDTRIRAHSPNDELGQLTKLFNAMLARNEALIRGMRQALDNVAHDLRTPLTRLRNTAELALQSNGDVAACRDALSDTLEESGQVSLVLDTLTDISEAETGIMKLSRADNKLSDVVGAVIDLYEFVAEERQIKVDSKVPEAVHCYADRGRLQQVLVNLLDNAIKYTPVGGVVEISAMEDTRETTITVKDTGPGISEHEIERIWERLYRGDQSRSQHGLGLGLSLVRAVMLAHKGTVEVRSEPGQGSTFVVRFPSANNRWRQTDDKPHGEQAALCAGSA